MSKLSSYIPTIKFLGMRKNVDKVKSDVNNINSFIKRINQCKIITKKEADLINNT